MFEKKKKTTLSDLVLLLGDDDCKIRLFDCRKRFVGNIYKTNFNAYSDWKKAKVISIQNFSSESIDVVVNYNRKFIEEQ